MKGWRRCELSMAAPARVGRARTRASEALRASRKPAPSHSRRTSKAGNLGRAAGDGDGDAARAGLDRLGTEALGGLASVKRPLATWIAGGCVLCRRDAASTSGNGASTESSFVSQVVGRRRDHNKAEG